jgi:hypothetical protein
MIERRDVLKLGAAASLTIGLSAPLMARTQGAAMWVRDMRYGRTGAGVSTAPEHVINGDVTALWTGALDDAWRGRGFVVAGVTGSDALFVLEQLAWSRGRRVTQRQQIAPAGDGLPALVQWAIEPVHPSVTI